MAEDKNGFRRHVRAAKEWLGETEDSLDKQEELKGDLNFMLAQAELKRAEEVQRPHRGLRLLPQLAALLTACLLAGGWWLWQQRTAVVQPGAAQPSQTLRQTEAVEARSPGRGTQAELLTAGQNAEPGQEDRQQEQAVQSGISGNDKTTEEEEAVKAEALEATKSAEQQVAMPEEDLQRLMSEAGRSLRAQ